MQVTPPMANAAPASKYVSSLVNRFLAGDRTVYETYSEVYGASHDRAESVSDADYIRRCSEQDYWDGFDGAAVYQEIFDQCNHENQ